MLRKMVGLVDSLAKAPNISSNSITSLDDTPNDDIRTILLSANSSRHVMPIYHGVLLLYLAGRFENYIRDLFEDMCLTIAQRCKKYTNLPKKMRENLISFTAKVMVDPHKFGHGDGGVSSFIKTLSSNIHDNDLVNINTQCLSITFENMRSNTIIELFGRVGLDKIWESMGQQIAVRNFFSEKDPQQATNKAKDLLDEIMNVRNRIAHPSGGFIWPSSVDIARYIDFLLILSLTLAEYCDFWPTTIQTETT